MSAKGQFNDTFMNLVLMGAFMALQSTAQAATIDVYPGDSVDTAVDAASPGDTVRVHPGVYNEGLTISRRCGLWDWCSHSQA